MMTTILEEAFKMASEFPEKEQEIIALHWIGEMKNSNYIEVIKDNMKWEKSFSESQDVLEILANKALEEIRDGKAEHTGWDEL